MRAFKAITTAILMFGFAASEDAVAAERRDDCGTAVPIYRALAAKGVVEAYKRLGYFNEIGYCTKRDWLEAAK